MVLQLFKETYNFKINLLELIDKDDIVRPAYDYIDGATKNNISRYSTHTTMTELKQDILEFAEDVAKEVRKIPGVRRVYPAQSSPAAGLSTYLTIDFTKPKDGEYLQNHKGNYSITIRLSDHYDGVGGIEDYDVDITYKKYNEFLDDIVNLVKQHINLLNANYQEWQKTHTTSNIQRYRNRRKKSKTYRALNRGERK